MAKPVPLPSFEAALSELETLVQAMEAGNTPLEESLAAFARGTSLLKLCQETLTQAEHKVQMLEGDTLRDFSTADDGGGSAGS